MTKKTNDEKFVNFKWDMDITNGDEFYWQGTWWILYHEGKNCQFFLIKLMFVKNVTLYII